MISGSTELENTLSLSNERDHVSQEEGLITFATMTQRPSC